MPLVEHLPQPLIRAIRAIAHPIGWVGCVLLTLTLGAGAALGHVEIIVDPAGVAADRGVTVFDLRRVEIAILGSDHVKARKVVRRTLRFGQLDSRGASPVGTRKKLEDVNGDDDDDDDQDELVLEDVNGDDDDDDQDELVLEDVNGDDDDDDVNGDDDDDDRDELVLKDVNRDGHDDLLVKFRMRETGLVEGEHAYAVLRGGIRDGPLFQAIGILESPIDACAPFQDGGTTVGVRCTYATSETPLDFSMLVQEINNSLGETGTVDGTSSVVVEAWGGKGHDGNKETTTTCTASPGDGGAAGYAQTIQTVDGITALLPTGADLYLYVGEKGPGNQHGGSASMAVGQAVTDITDTLDPAGQLVLAIAAGGGGGGKGTFKDIDCFNGRDGGDGAEAVADTTGDSSTAGEDGAKDHKGRGGNPADSNDDHNGTGGAANGDGKAGADGIGGFGSQGLAGWAGTDLTTDDWNHGKGGEGGGSENAGGGGGGFGGGGGGQAADHKGGGGGGGSWARQSSVDAGAVSDLLILGPSYDPGTPAVTLTFEVPPPADPATSTITAAPTSLPFDGTCTSTITVQLKDVFTNNLTSGGDTVTLATDLGTLSAVTDNGDGTYTATLTCSTTVGTATITGTVNAAAITDNATVDFL